MGSRTVRRMEAGARPRAVAVASGMLFAVSAMMAVWGAATLARAGEFGAAAYRFSASHPDIDIAPGYFEIAFWLAAIASLLAALGFSALGFADLRGAPAARVTTWIAGCAALPFVYLTYEDHGEPYLFPGTASSAAGPMRALTPWRFSGRYHDLTTGLGVLTIAGLTAVIVLLALPASASYFRPHRRTPD
jgi:hypothetical protein